MGRERLFLLAASNFIFYGPLQLNALRRVSTTGELSNGTAFSFRLHSTLQIRHSDSARYIEVYALSYTHACVLNFGDLRINAAMEV
jgi:hypothetical protein